MTKSAGRDVTRLPVWAQEHIAQLKRDLASERETKRATEAGDTLLSWRDELGGDEIWLPTHARVSFWTNKEKPSQNVNVHLRRRYGHANEPWVVAISSGGNTSSPLVVLPEAANLIYAFPEPWDGKA